MLQVSPQNFRIICRKFSTTQHLCRWKISPKRRPIYYTTIYEEPVRSDRSAVQRLLNKGRKLMPFDKRFPVTGKNTGLGVHGGSKTAQALAAVHRVQPTGYINNRGKYVGVPAMAPEFVVPDLSKFQLKPYVPYDRVTEVDKGQHTARELFDAFYAEKIKQDFYAKQEAENPKRKTLLDKFRKTS